jgi:hypothetical protein
MPRVVADEPPRYARERAVADRAVLEVFGRFWQEETDPAPRRQLVQQLFERVWVDGQKIVAVRPTPAFAGLFTSSPSDRAASADGGCAKRERRDSNPRPPA